MLLGQSGGVADQELQPHTVSVTGDDASGQGLLLVVADEHPVSGLRIERQIIGTLAMRDPAGAHGLDATTHAGHDV